MPMLRRLTAVAVLTSCLLLPAAPAFSSAKDVIKDCNDNGRLTKEYSQKEYREALANMPADLKQYTDCENIIRRAQLGLRGSTGGSANSANPFAGATPEEVAQAKKDIAAARKTGGAGQRIGDAVVLPGSLAFTRASAATSELPGPLLALIALILLATGAFAAQVFYSRRHGREPGA
jgi:hypothetical protein